MKALASGMTIDRTELLN